MAIPDAKGQYDRNRSTRGGQRAIPTGKAIYVTETADVQLAADFVGFFELVMKFV